MNNDIAQQIKDANKGRETGTLKIKYKVMAESPFRFFRGSCQLFYSELFKQYPFPVSPVVWACGDLHIENFGSYKGSNRLVYFDLNDFDEALLAPALWEICRLAASVQVAASAAGFSGKEKNDLVKALLNSYRNTLRKAKSTAIEKETASGLIKKLVNKVADRKEMDLVKKRTDKLDPGKLLVTDRLFVLPKPGKKALISAFNKWHNTHTQSKLQAIDAGFRIAGTGSIGVERYVLLLANAANPQKKLLLDIKQAMPPAGGTYVNIPQPVWQHEAARIIAIQEMTQEVSPAFLSSFQYNEKQFVIKELQPTADKVNMFQTIKQPEYMGHYLEDLGMLSASAQLRSSGRLASATADELSYFAAGDDWINILIDWSAYYAKQLKQEYKLYREAWQDGFFNS